MKTILFSIALFFLCVNVFAQKMKIESGKFDYLKGQNKVNVIFDYSNLKINKENLTNDQYVTERVKELNEKSPGNGDTWKKRWDSAPELFWNPKFLELINSYLGKEKGIQFGENLNDAKYTLVVNVDWLYPGWDAGVMKQPAKVTTTLKFVETSSPSNVLAELSSKEAPGNQWGSNFNNETRIAEGFAKTAKTLSKELEKKF